MFTGGGLKLKGGSSVGKKKKKVKKSVKETEEGEQPMEQTQKEAQQKQAPPPKTEAELNLERIQKERLDKKIEMLAEKSHKDRVNDFNKYLSKLSEHHDIPRVGPG